MPPTPTFAVIIPVYNGERYLRETLDTVLAQTLSPREIFVIDDGSPRPSRHVVEPLSSRIHYTFRSNHGVSATRNFGAALASAEWLSFLDQDDLWTPDHLARQADAIARTPAADVCYSDRMLLRNDEQNPAWHLAETAHLPTPEALPRVLLDRCPITPSSVSIRRTVFERVGGYSSRHDFCEDWELWLRLMRDSAVFAHVADPTLHYRVLTTGNSHNPLPILHANLRVVQTAILPFLSPLARQTHGRRVISRLEAEAAILLRQTQRPGAFRMMLHSLARHPFHELRRYKIAAHMLLHPGAQLPEKHALPA